MEIALILSVVTVAGICLIFLLDNQSNPLRGAFWSQRHRHGRGQHKAPARSYQAVSVIPCENSCGSAKALGDTRFLADEAPGFPVPGCDRIECDCRYQHHEDRRSGQDRRHLGERRAGARIGSDRRQNRGRRRSDWHPLAA